MIKTNKVIIELVKMDIQIEKCGKYLYLARCEDNIASIKLDEKFNIDTDYVAFRNNLSEDEQEKVYVLLTKLAETDPKDREEEKKYYLRHKWLADSDDYLNFYIEHNEYNLSTANNFSVFKTQFTQAEIDELKRKFKTNLEDFEMIEVEE